MPLFKAQLGILLYTSSWGGGVGVIIHQALLLCEDRLVLTVKTALDML